ncbi:MAG: S8 family serine peptidase [Ignavibacteriales bacterium]|nr:S8 family serine peptidase [Ignavibacteriales bacterium]
MKFSYFFIVTLILTISNFAQTTYFIKYKNSVSIDMVDQKISQQKISDILTNRPVSLPSFNINYLAKGLGRGNEILGRIVKVQFSENVEEEKLISILSSDTDIEYIQKSINYSMDIIPNDSLISQQWALEKIDAFDAWDITQGADTVLLAIIDTGIDYNHIELKNKIFINAGEVGTDNQGRDKQTNNIDDDGNGFIDDYRGWDFTDRVGFPFDSTGGDYLNWDNNPIDENGHGTYIAGIAGAESNNISGISGTAPKIKLLNLRAFDPSGYGEEDDVAAAILYAVQAGVKIINMSFGDNSFSFVLKDVIQFAYSQNVVLVGSAGNSGSPDPHYPSGYSEVIAVGNSTQEDFVSSNSNYGSTIDLVAPGTLILTTDRDNNYAVISGTSASAPFVSAAAGLILSLQNFTNEEIKQILKSTSEDIDSPGWDLKSGAGRLNLFNAVSVIAPSIIKFHYPLQDFSTLNDTISIYASILSPYFISYKLYYGPGFNPDDWNTLIENGVNQFSNQKIFTLAISNLPDTVYTLRLEVQLNNGRTLEERINFHINRTPPDVQLVSIVPAFYGEKTTVLASLYSDQSSTAKMFYKKIGDINYNFITLDGFTINNKFVKQLHYGFIPKQLVEQNSQYEIYFEVENLVGLKTEIKNDGQNFLVNTDYNAEFASEEILPFNLPAGEIYREPISLTSNDSKEIVLREFDTPKTSFIYKWQQGFNSEWLQKEDSLSDQIVKDFGDFNNNQKKDMLTYFVYDGFMYEQADTFSSQMIQKFSRVGERFWPVLAKDVDGDGITNLIVLDSDTSAAIYNIGSDFSISNKKSLVNFTANGFGGQIFDSPNALLADMNGDGKNEIWFVDTDGDIFNYDIVSAGNYQQGSVIETGFLSSSSFLTSGDYDGDGTIDMAVLLHSIEEIDIAPFYRLIVFNLKNDQFNVLYDQGLIDASIEFNSTFQKSEQAIRFADIDNDGKDELLAFVFPYSYIFKLKDGATKIISFKENINSNTIFVGDLNTNNIMEIGFPTSNGIAFSEFSLTDQPSVPNNLTGFSLNENSIKLNWSGNANSFIILRGTEENNLLFIDSTDSKEYSDSNLNANVDYYYALQGVDYSKPYPYSSRSSVIKIFTHSPAKLQSAESKSSKSVIVRFSERVNTTIENLESFEIKNFGFPNSISPNDQFSYLLSFKNNLPLGSNTLYVNNLKDDYGSPIESDSTSFFVNNVIEIEDFFISSFDIIDQNNVKLIFNLELDENSINDLSNYRFNPDNKVISAKLDPADKKVLYITIDKNKPVGSIGIQYTLQLKNISSTEASGKIAIGEGAGSYIVLTKFAENLSDVYVYPNPVRDNGSDLKITFANLPQYARVTIWTIDGVKINELEEKNGDGGLEFNLRNFNGDEIGSGIYFYRVIKQDELGEELEEKIGKFAVIK